VWIAPVIVPKLDGTRACRIPLIGRVETFSKR